MPIFLQAIAVPTLDYLSDNSIKSHTLPIKWTFDLQLTVIPFEDTVSDMLNRNNADPIPSPALDGSVFALNRVRNAFKHNT